MTKQKNAFGESNRAKANFDRIYLEPDPRAYYRVLGGLDYVIPDLARTVFSTLARARRDETGRRLKILDLGCSYGVNTALIRYPLNLDRLAERYTSRAMQSLEPDMLARLDESFFRSWPLSSDATFIGLDPSEAAARYAVNAGILQGAVTTDLENNPPAASDLPLLRGTDLVISTGCVGYVTEKTFGRILEQQTGTMPWVASFVLRMFSYDAIAAEMERFGLVTEKLEGVTFVQRRFHSQEEWESTLRLLQARGIDPEGKESKGLYHAELFVSRPRDSVARARLGEIVSVTSGAHRHYEKRYQRRSGRLH